MACKRDAVDEAGKLRLVGSRGSAEPALEAEIALRIREAEGLTGLLALVRQGQEGGFHGAEFRRDHPALALMRDREAGALEADHEERPVGEGWAGHLLIMGVWWDGAVAGRTTAALKERVRARADSVRRSGRHGDQSV